MENRDIDEALIHKMRLKKAASNQGLNISLM